MLVQLKEGELDIELEIAYATKNNFMGKELYKNPLCFLHQDAFLKLKDAIEIAANLGFKIKIFDAFRPLEVQQVMWNQVQDVNFISNPANGAVPHCRGVAVDLTLLDSSGDELEMGTGFDEFSEKSFHGNQEISKKAFQNRLILMGIMTTAGWDFYRNEWWHYQLFEPRKYNVLAEAEVKTGIL